MVERGQLPAAREPLMTGAAGAPTAAAPASGISEKSREVPYGGAAGYYAPNDQSSNQAMAGPSGQDWAYRQPAASQPINGSSHEQPTNVHPALRPSQDGAGRRSSETAGPVSPVTPAGRQAPQIPEVTIGHAD